MADSLTLPDFRNERFFKELTSLPFIEAIYIYGSHAGGNATEKSDVDMAIMCPDASDQEWERARTIISTHGTLMKIEAVWFDKKSRAKDPDYYDSVIRQRVLIYLRQPPQYLDMLDIRLNELKEKLSLLQRAIEQHNTTAVLQLYDRSFFFLLRTMRRAMLAMGKRTFGLNTLRLALRLGWIEDRKQWERMYNDWQLSQKPIAPYIAQEIIGRLPTHMNYLQAALHQVEIWYKEELETYKILGFPDRSASA